MPAAVAAVLRVRGWQHGVPGILIVAAVGLQLWERIHVIALDCYSRMGSHPIRLRVAGHGGGKWVGGVYCSTPSSRTRKGPGGSP